MQSFDVFVDLHLYKHWVNNREAGDLGRRHAHYDITVMSQHTLHMGLLKKITSPLAFVGFSSELIFSHMQNEIWS